MYKKNRLTIYTLLLIILLCFLPNSSVIAYTNHSRNEAVAWMQARENERWAKDVDSSYGAQCVDLILYYFDYLVGYHLWGNACDYVGREDLPEGWTYQFGTSH